MFQSSFEEQLGLLLEIFLEDSFWILKDSFAGPKYH